MSTFLQRLAVLAGIGVFLLLPSSVQAQARPGRLIITVTDATDAVLPNATVTVAGLEDATKRAPIPVVKADQNGVATLPNLVPGQYSVRAEFPTLDVGVLREVRVRSGDNRHTIVLPLGRVTESVSARRDQEEEASDRSSSFGAAMTREQIESLSDDPDEMRRQLQDLAGPGAVISVDSFEGQPLPSKAQIKMIRITRDQFAAENHSAGGIRIEIVTQPGIGPLRGNVGFNFYDSSMDGRNPFVAEKPASQNRSMNLSFGGSLMREKMSFQIGINGSNNYSTPVQFAFMPGGSEVKNLQRQPFRNAGVSGLIDYALTRDQTLRVGFQRSGSRTQSGGGGFDLAERGYATETTTFAIRAQEVGPIGRRFFLNTRFSLNMNDSVATSSIEAPTIIVNDAFTSGGAQRTGGTHTRTFMVASDLDYVRGVHGVRAGIQIDGSRYRSDSATNYLGTYTFASLEAFQAGQPRSYTRRIGDPNVQYWNVQTGLFIQDDIRVRKNLTITPGLRYEMQTLLDDKNNFAPRFGFTWAPFPSGSTTLRASWGLFYDWLSAGTYEQTLRVDGFRQQEVNIVNPSYPDPGPVGDAPATNRYLLGEDLMMGRNNRVSLGMSQRITPTFTVGATFAAMRGNGVLVGYNLNAPVDGVRPDPTFANVVEARSVGRMRQQSLNANFQVNLAGSGPQAAGGRLFNWRRSLYLSGGYTISKNENDSDGAFAIPASSNLADEWGPASGDRRHSGSVSIGSQAIRGLNASINVFASSAPPLTIRTGTDDNGDLVFNDRPAGVGRNSARTAGQVSSSAYFSYSIGLGKRQVERGPGISITSVGGTLSATTVAAQAQARYRLTLSVSINNLTNHKNYVGYSGVMLSPAFMQPTGVSGTRRITFNTGLSF